MKYSLQQLDKAAIIINQIKELDASIIALDDLALKVSENNIDYTLKVKGDIKSDKKESILDSDDSLKKSGDVLGDMYFSKMLFGIQSKSAPKPDNTLLDITIKDVDMLTILGMVITNKYQQREALKQQIRELDIEI